jgi:predicted transcriptional regulator/predicted GH43/DUF377 family glycosyl hydrolase
VSRRRSRILLILLLTLALSPWFPQAAAAPVYESRQIALGPGPAGAWDQEGVMQPTVLLSGGLHRMWYTGTDGLTTGIGYAVSGDGRQWNRVLTDPVTIGGSGWAGVTKHPSVLPWGTDGYQMWFSRDITGGAIGHATTTDGISWGNANTVMQAEVSIPWEKGGIGEPTVLRDPSGFWMWYVGVDASGGNASIGLATSADGVNWTRAVSNPVLRPAAGEWYSAGVRSPAAVILSDGTFVLWFNGTDGQSSRIGRMTSRDGVSWSAPELVLDLGEAGTADGRQVGDPAPSAVDMDALWYAGFDGLTWRILLAVPQRFTSSPSIVTSQNAAAAFTMGVTLVAIAAFISSERFKYAFFAIPLAFGRRKNNLLDNFVRGQIYQYIKENPGGYFSSIMNATGATNGNLTHHLFMLERAGYIKHEADGRRVCFYTKDTPFPKGDGIRYSALQVRILEQITKMPGINQTKLAKMLAMKKQTVAYNIWVLVDYGVIEVRKIGNKAYLHIAKEPAGQEVPE